MIHRSKLKLFSRSNRICTRFCHLAISWVSQRIRYSPRPILPCVEDVPTGGRMHMGVTCRPLGDLFFGCNIEALGRNFSPNDYMDLPWCSRAPRNHMPKAGSAVWCSLARAGGF